MSSLVEGRLLGVQTPRHHLAPLVRQNEAEDATFLASRYGLTPDPWQQLVLASWLGVREDGQWAARRCGLAVPRQNGKNGIIEIRELFGMVVLGEKFLHTAHEVKTSHKAFLRLCSFFEDRRFPELMALAKNINRSVGQEAIILTNGGSCEFAARSRGSARGFTVDILVMDEAQELGDDAVEALLPTISAGPSGNPQQIFTGTPPGPKANGEIFTGVRADGLEGKDEALAWDEWSCPSDADLDDLQNVALSNPAYGLRVHEDVIFAERSTLSDSGYGRERLGIWDNLLASRVIPNDAWLLSADELSAPVGIFALAADVSPDRSRSSVSFAGLRADGNWHVSLDESRDGVAWVAPYIANLCAKNSVGNTRIRAVVIDGSSPAASVIEDLARLKIRVTITNARDVAQSFGSFYDGIINQTVFHTSQGQLNASLAVARKRELAGGYAWSRKDTASDITPLVSCTLALWGAQHLKVKRPGGGRTAGRERRSTGNRTASMIGE